MERTDVTGGGLATVEVPLDRLDRLERRRVMWRRIVVTQVDRLAGRAGGSDIAARDAAARADRLVALLELDGTAPSSGAAN